MSYAHTFTFAPGDPVGFVGGESWTDGEITRVMAGDEKGDLYEVRHPTRTHGLVTTWYQERLLRATGKAEPAPTEEYRSPYKMGLLNWIRDGIKSGSGFWDWVLMCALFAYLALMISKGQGR